MSVDQDNGEAAVAEDVAAPAGATVTQFELPFPDGEAAAVAVADDAIPLPVAIPAPVKRRLRAGCYFLRYTPTPSVAVFPPLHYDGTLRVQRDGFNTIASGDLYLHRPILVHPLIAPKEPNPAAGIPIFPIANYRYYVRVTRILEGPLAATSFILGFELRRYDHATKTWSNEGAFTARLAWTPGPAGYPSPSDFLSGTVRNAAGNAVGALTLGWVSKHLRRATIELDRVSHSERAVANAAGVGWRAVFQQVGWDVTVDESDTNVAEPSGQSWSDAEAHAAMLARRDSANLNAEWRYYLLAVRRLDSTPRGIMFDNGGTDSNKVPREGAAMASHWTIPNGPPWGHVAGMRFGLATDAYFRTGVHELGHAMGLVHNTADNGFMNTTDVIAGNAVPPQQFPDNVQWSHAPDDQMRLRHMPDIWVRPGGQPFGSSAPISAPDAVLDPDGVTLEVQPLAPTAPLGAPVRVDMRLRNDAGIPVPVDLSLRAGHVEGTVTDASGTVRTFRTIVHCVDGHTLEDRAEVTGSLTLLRGAEGALFPLAGPYTIRVDVSWDLDGTSLKTSGEGVMMVTPAVDQQHAEAALRVITTPDTLVTLALGGDHLPDAQDAIQTALASDVLRPHFAFIEAKRLAVPFFDRPAEPDSAAQLLDDSTVMSAYEAAKATRMLA